MPDIDKIAGLLMDELDNIRTNLTGRDCFAERVADSIRRADEAIKLAEEAGVQPVTIGDYLYS